MLEDFSTNMDSNVNASARHWRYVIGCQEPSLASLFFPLTNQQHHGGGGGGASRFLHGIRCRWCFNHSSNLLPELKCIWVHSWLKHPRVMFFLLSRLLYAGYWQGRLTLCNDEDEDARWKGCAPRQLHGASHTHPQMLKLLPPPPPPNMQSCRK